MKTTLQEINDFETKDIEIVRGYNFNQKKTLEKIYLYYNSKYKSGDIDSEGFKKYFMNITRNPCNVATKAIDFDTKDIRIQTAGGGSPLKTWFFERDLKFWMKDIHFGKDLNRIFYELPIFGSVVIKIIDGKVFFVDLRNFVVEQCADTLEKANYVIEIHNYTVDEFRKLGKKNNWKKVKETIDEFRKTDKAFIRVYERYGEYEEKGKYKYGRTLGVSFESNEEDIDAIDFTLEQTETKLPYREFHWEKIPGRWLGVGRAEIIFDPQIRMNELTNLKVKSSYWAALRLFQTRDDGVGRNLLTETKNGEILNVDSEITPVPTEERNLHAYDQEETRWLSNRDEMTLAFDVLRGERLPSGTPLGSAQLAAGMAGAYFDVIRENVAEGIKKLLFDDIIPNFRKKNSGEHILRIAGEDLDKLNKLIIKARTWYSSGGLIGYLARNSKLPTNVEREMIEATIGEEVKANKEQLVTIPEGFYKDLKYKIDIIITGEQEDTRVQAANLQIALQLYGSNPDLLNDPVGKRIFYRMLEKGGISPIDFEGEQEQPSIGGMRRQGGGGVARPVIANTPTREKSEATV